MPDIKCDIIIPVWNEVEFTKKCIKSIIKSTSLPYRIIIVDNASAVETASYLKELVLKDKNLITLIRNEENLGFPKAVNQGMAVSSSPYLCILNNDTEVCRNWLSEMINIAESHPDIGILNPTSNNLGQTRPKQGFMGKWIEMASCIGFCMLIKREVIQNIGNFDEIFSPGNFEDTDFCRRAVKAGYKCAMAKGSYVYHSQNTGFKKRKDWEETFKRNLDIFNKRWGRVKRIAYIIKGIKGPQLNTVQDEIKSHLKNGDWVYVFIRKGSLRPVLSEHASLRIVEIGRFMFDAKVMWLIAAKKKKFDKVVL